MKNGKTRFCSDCRHSSSEWSTLPTDFCCRPNPQLERSLITGSLIFPYQSQEREHGPLVRKLLALLGRSTCGRAGVFFEDVKFKGLREIPIMEFDEREPANGNQAES